MKEYFSVLTWQDVFLAACLAYVITYIIRSFQRWIDRRVEKTFVVR